MRDKNEKVIIRFAIHHAICSANCDGKAESKGISNKRVGRFLKVIY